ncbi:MAG: hypothetical protein QOF49_172, partial [Chloroflexota bacterium]|nr:hypothetical protein [Chloroflexota bacterium]
MTGREDQRGGDGGRVPADPAADPAADLTASEPANSDGATADEASADQLSLGRRLRQPRTIISLILPIILLVLFTRALPGFKLDQIPGLILKANPLLLLLAFAVFYAGFPLRGLRWAILIR